MNTAKTIKQLITDFVESRDITEESRKTMAIGINQFYIYLVKQGRPANKPNENDPIRWKKNLLLSSKSVWTINSYLHSLKSYFHWLEENKIYSDITKGTKPLKMPEGFSKEPLTIEELQAILKPVDNSQRDKRNQLLIKILYSLGLRSIEVSRLNVCDLTGLPEHPALLIQGKGEVTKKPIAITLQLATDISNFLKRSYQTDKNNPMFVSFHNSKEYRRMTPKEIGRQITQRMEAAGINRDKKSTHSLRHTAARDVLEATQDIYRTQLFMRHRNPQTTKIYLTYGKEHYLRQRELETILQKNFNLCE